MDDEELENVQGNQSQGNSVIDDAVDVADAVRRKKKKSDDKNKSDDGKSPGEKANKDKSKKSKNSHTSTPDNQPNTSSGNQPNPKSTSQAGQKTTSKTGQKATSKTGQKATSQAGQEAAKHSVKSAVNSAKGTYAKATAKVAKMTAKVTKLAAKLLPILATIALVIVIFIAVVGIIVFLISGMGLIWNGILKVTDGVKDWWTSITEGEEHIVKKETVEDVLTYLNGMGYDLYGYGFITTQDAVNITNGNRDEQVSGEIQEVLEENENGEENDDSEDDSDETSASTVTINGDYWNESDEENVIIDAFSTAGNYLTGNAEEISRQETTKWREEKAFKYIKQYIISDNYVSIMKNNNANFETAFSSWKNFVSGLYGSTDWRKWSNFSLL